MIPLLLRELEDQSEVLARAEAKARSAVKAAQRRLNEETGHVARLGRGAELALRFGEEHTAREALARQVVAERSVRAAEENLAQADKALQDAREVRSGILRQQDDLRRRAAEFQQRGTHAAQGHTALAAAAEAEKTGTSILDRVSAMEDRLPSAPAAGPGAREMVDPGAPLMERLSRLERRASVEERLAALRRQAEGNKGH